MSHVRTLVPGLESRIRPLGSSGSRARYGVGTGEQPCGCGGKCGAGRSASVGSCVVPREHWMRGELIYQSGLRVRSGVLAYSTFRCSSVRTLVDDAVAFINANINDVPTTIVANSTPGCNGSSPLTRFGGHSHRGIVSPRTLVQRTVNGTNGIAFRINCEDQDAFVNCTTNCLPKGWTACGQWNDPVKDINLCRTWLGRGPTDEEVACVIVHEIMHIWGADENAARDVHVRTGWTCPSLSGC